MANRLYKLKQNIHQKRYSLRSVCAGIVFFAFLYGITKAVKITLCPIKRFLGINCFGCGLSRAFVCALQGDVIAAIRHNVLVIPLAAGILVYTALLLSDILLGTDCSEKAEAFLAKKYMYPVYIFVLVLCTFLNTLIL